MDISIEANHSHEPDPSTVCTESFPQECDPNRHIDWRFRYAAMCPDQCEEVPIRHDDPWIQAAIDFRLATELQNREPTQTDHAIFEATQLWQSDSLARYLLEARLLAQEDPEEIHTRCQLSPLTITAYSKLHFDVCGRDRKGIWLLRPLSSGLAVNTPMCQFGWRLKSLACFSTSEELEEHICVLKRIEGKTLGTGLPPPDVPGFAQSTGQRLSLARALFPIDRSTEKLMRRFTAAAAAEVQTGRTSQHSRDLLLRILRKVKLPEGLPRELRLLRESRATVRSAA